MFVSYLTYGRCYSHEHVCDLLRLYILQIPDGSPTRWSLRQKVREMKSSFATAVPLRSRNYSQSSVHRNSHSAAWKHIDKTTPQVVTTFEAREHALFELLEKSSTYPVALCRITAYLVQHFCTGRTILAMWTKWLEVESTACWQEKKKEKIVTGWKGLLVNKSIRSFMAPNEERLDGKDLRMS